MTKPLSGLVAETGLLFRAFRAARPSSKCLLSGLVVETECDNVVMMVFKYGTVPARIAPVIGAEQAAIQIGRAHV